MSGSWLTPARKRGLIMVVLALIQAALGLVAARTYLARHNTLQANGRWRSTKIELARGVNGAFSYFTGRQALANGELDLGAWHGFQEIVNRREIDSPTRIEFDFRLRTGAYVVALFDRDRLGRGAGVRLSSERRYPSALLEIGPDGDFYSNTQLPGGLFTSNVQHHADIRLGPSEVAVTVDGKPAGTTARAWQGRPLFGFRGSLRYAVIDNVAVTLASGERLLEDFDAPAGALLVTVATPCAVIILNLALFALLARRPSKRPNVLVFKFLLANLTLLVAGLLIHRFVLEGGSWYPKMNALLQKQEEYYMRGATTRVVDEIHERTSGRPPADHERILVVGTSQTWGAGAERDDQAWVVVLETLLNARGDTRGVECVNGGICALNAGLLEPLVMEKWLALEPDLVVINLSSNDKYVPHKDAFTGPMTRMIEEARRRGACPVLVKEANALGASDRGLTARHREVEALGKRFGLPVIDMHHYMQDFEDQGFLWWDKVHMTAFGQRVVAEKLARELAPLLDHEPASARAITAPATVTPGPESALPRDLGTATPSQAPAGADGEDGPSAEANQGR